MLDFKSIFFGSFFRFLFLNIMLISLLILHTFSFDHAINLARSFFILMTTQRFERERKREGIDIQKERGLLYSGLPFFYMSRSVLLSFFPYFLTVDCLTARACADSINGRVRIRHSSYDLGCQSSHSVDLAGWQAKMASINFGYHDVMRTSPIVSKRLARMSDCPLSI